MEETDSPIILKSNHQMKLTKVFKSQNLNPNQFHTEDNQQQAPNLLQTKVLHFIWMIRSLKDFHKALTIFHYM